MLEVTGLGAWAALGLMGLRRLRYQYLGGNLCDTPSLTAGRTEDAVVPSGPPDGKLGWQVYLPPSPRPPSPVGLGVAVSPWGAENPANLIMSPLTQNGQDLHSLAGHIKQGHCPFTLLSPTPSHSLC